MNPKPLSFSERLAFAVFRRVYKASTGFEHDAVVEEAIRFMGVRGFLRYIKFIDKFVKNTSAIFGGANTQTLIGLAALMAGCGYCGYGHTLTGALMEFKDSGQLHPIHPFSIVELFEHEDHEIVEKLDEMLSKPGYEDLRRYSKRMYEMFLGELEPEDEDDELLKSIIDFWAWTVECTIVEGVSITPENAKVMNELGRDRALRERYEQARAAERAQSRA